MNEKAGRDGARGRRGVPRLFEPDELAFRPTGQARLRALARRPAPTPTEREARQREDDEMMARLRGWGRQLCDIHGLRFRSIDPEKEGVTEHYGICYEDGLIRIRLRHARTGELLKESSLVDTLCHELAHLRHLDHSIRFRKLYQRILAAARRLGYYQPGSASGRGVSQLPLFSEETCGVDGSSGN